jgi:hypothetical protein
MENDNEFPELDGIELEPSPLPDSIEVTELPALSGVPERFQQMLVLRAMGFTYQSIGEQFQVSHVAVRKACIRYDPDGQVNMSKDDRRSFLVQLYEAKAAEALMYLTPDKIKNASPAVMAKIAASFGTVAERLRGTGVAGGRMGSNLEKWLKKIEESRDSSSPPQIEESRSLPEPDSSGPSSEAS